MHVRPAVAVTAKQPHHAPPVTHSVKASFILNDPGMTLSAKRGVFTLSGVATDNGLLPNTLILTTPKGNVGLNLEGGQTAAEVARLLKARLPVEVEYREVAHAKGSVSFKLLRKEATRNV